jgi:hypothetical protein
MAVLKFRVYLEEDDSIYRDIAIHHSQQFILLHEMILKAYEFDTKHKATFYRSNDSWQKGKEVTFEKYDKEYAAEPLMMRDTTIGSQIFSTTQKFIYHYDFDKNWMFLVELINVSKEEVDISNYPNVSRKEGIAPSQYGTKSLLGTNQVTEVEEKYDLNALTEGFSVEGGTEE